MTVLSVLDLAPISQGSNAAETLHRSADLARHCEQLGYRRYWLAEHHNMPGIASAATALAISHVAAATAHIRVGAGGIMLPNHAPLIVAEQFGTLASLYPGRIDLGVGRAPGTDPQTAYALRRNLHSDVEQFPQDVAELLGYFADDSTPRAVRAIPGAGMNVPVWILGSSLFGAQLAAQLGLPYAFASHFSPAQLHDAIALYRRAFRPSKHCEKPYVMVGFNAFAADSAPLAELLASSMQQAFVNLRRGTPGMLAPPVSGFMQSLPDNAQAELAAIMHCTAIGDGTQVGRAICDFADSTGADEVIIASQMYDHRARLRCYELIAQTIMPTDRR